MSTNKTDIYVYAHWLGMQEPQIIGILSAQQAKSKKAFSFEYDADWLKSGQKFMLDPDIQLYGGPQYPNQKENFGIFLDSMPDTWGRTLMKRRAAQQAKQDKEKTPTLYRSAIAYSILVKNGFENIKNYSGGMAEWKKANKLVIAE